MPLEIKRKEKESVQSLIYRFKRGAQESGILVRAKQNNFHKRQESDLAKKKHALRRIEIEKEYKRLRKLGKVA